MKNIYEKFGQITKMIYKRLNVYLTNRFKILNVYKEITLFVNLEIVLN